jgi:hypothetical protein
VEPYLYLSLPALAAILGCVLFVVSKKGAKDDRKEIGRIMFMCGFFALCWFFARAHLSLH